MDNAANNTVVLVTVTDFGITLPCGLPQLYYVRTYINRISNKALIFCEESCSLNFPDIAFAIAVYRIITRLCAGKVSCQLVLYPFDFHHALRPYGLVICISLSTIVVPIDFFAFRLHSRLPLGCVVA